MQALGDSAFESTPSTSASTLENTPPTYTSTSTSTFENSTFERRLTPFDIPSIWTDISKHISCQHHLYAFLRVNRTCFRHGVRILWGEPRFMRKKTFTYCLKILKRSRTDPNSTLFPYYEYPKLFRLKRIASDIDGSELEDLYECCQNVTEIMLRNSANLSGDRFVNIANLTPNVTVAHLGGNLHHDFKPDHMIAGLQKWKKLSNLEIDDPDESTSLMEYGWFTDEVMNCIFRNSVGMEEIILYNVTSMTDKGLEGLRTYGDKLTLMQLWRTGQVRDHKGAIESISKCSRLVELDVSSDFLVDDNALISLTESLKGLRSIGFSVWDHLTDESIVALAQNLENLEDIQIRGSINITSKSLHALAKYRGNRLKDLVILHVPRVTDEGLIDILKCCNSLSGLEVSQLEGVTDESFRELVKYRAKSIERLSLSRMHIKPKTVEEIIRTCKNLSLLEIRCSSTLDLDDQLLLLEEYGRKLEVLTYECQDVLRADVWTAICNGCSSLYSLKLEGGDISKIPPKDLEVISKLHHLEQLEISVSNFPPSGQGTSFEQWFKETAPRFGEWCTSLTDIQLSVDSVSNTKEGENLWREMREASENTQDGEPVVFLSHPNIKFVELDQFDFDDDESQ